MLIKTHEDLVRIVEFLKPMHVKRICVDGIEIEFDTTAALVAGGRMPDSIDDEVEAQKPVKSALERMMAESKADEEWSA